MRVIVDYGLCEANAICMKLAPEVFKVDDNDDLQVLQEVPAEELRAKVERAVAKCPKSALALKDE